MRKIVALISIVCILATGCMPTSEAEKQEKETGKEKVNYTKIEDMDFSSSHINGVLRENFIIDADIPVAIPAECGTYELSNKVVDKSQEEYEKELAKLINEYYNENIAIVDDGVTTIDEEIPNCFYNGNMGDFQKGNYNDYNSMHQKINIIAKNFYEYGLEYDKAFVDGVVNEFLQHFESVVPDGMNGDYECVHIDDEYWEYLEGKYTQEEMESIFDKTDMEFYAVSMYSEIEEGLYFKAHSPISYNHISGEILDEVTNIEEGNVLQSHRPQWLQMIISEEGEVLSVRFNDYYVVGDKITTESIIGVKEALQLFYNEYEGIILDNEVIVKAITLEYMVRLDDELGENGFRNAYLEPVWVFRFDSELERFGLMERTYAFSAVDGTLLLGKNDAY